MDNALDAIIAIDQRGIVQVFNPAAEKMFRCPAADIVGKNINILVPEPHRQQHDRYLAEYMRTGQRKIIGIGQEVTAQRLDGTTFSTELAVSEFKSGDRYLFTAIMRDLTDRKAAEAHREADAAEARVKSLLDTVMRTVTDYVTVVERVTAGDLLQRVTVEGDDILMQLGTNINVMVVSFLEIIRSAHEAIGTVMKAVRNLETDTASLSSGAMEQATSINQTTAALEEIRTMSRQTLDKASSLGTLAERASEASAQGRQSISDIVTSMNQIRDKVQHIADTILALSEQTQQISEITDIVSRLAQESKMLALNASIEAAKAGEVGVGFAVVATEVKALAEQSEQATAQVRRILREIQHATDRAVMTTEEGTKKVDQGISIVEYTSESFNDLAKTVDETALGSRQITAAVRQESTSIEQITMAMAEINKATGQTLDIAERSRQTSANLSIVAQEMESWLTFYKVSA
ncbi:MAG: methyl-accepting chemotaxis sensory transducer [Rhodospirillaceae bacterium]|nr:MAG: methyl-accepting chemotaxis sensory transducer [Rhodospirillaceae bacterium]